MIETLHADQVWDISRTSFIVGLQADGKAKHLGEQVYKDAYGRRFIIKQR